MQASVKDGLEQPQRGWALLAILVGILIANLDGGIANVALPAMTQDFGATPASTVWVVNAYQLSMAICILPFAALGESLGYRRVYWLGLFGFTICSLACALSPSLTALIIARGLQGASAAAIASVSQALTRIIYPRRILGSGMSWNTLMVAVSFGLGPIVGSLVLSVTGWPWLFAINVPIGAFALAVGLRALPETPLQPRSFDWTGAALNGAVFVLFILGLDSISEPDGRLLAAGEILLAAALAWVLYRHQSTKPAALLPLDLFRLPIFALSALTSICSYAAQSMGLIALPFFIADVLKRGQWEMGLLIAPWPLAVACVARLSGRLSDKYPAGVLAGIGLALMAGGLASLAALPADASPANMVWRVILCGLGFGFFQTPNNKTMMVAGPIERSGAANGAMAGSRLMGQTIGAAAAGVVFALAHESATPSTFIGAALFAAFGAVVSLLRLSGPQGFRAPR